MADLVTLSRKRTAAKGWLSRCMAKCQEALEQDVDQNQELLFEQKKELESRLSTFDDLQSEIEVLFASEDEMMEDIEKAAVFRDSVKAVLVKLGKALNRSDARSVAGSAGSVTGVKLPKIDLPKFAGDVLKWQSFWEVFKASVHDADLPDVTKFSYLRSLLVGEAATCISGLSLECCQL